MEGELKRKVVMALDDTPASSYTFAWGLRNLVRKDDHVIILTAAPFVVTDVPSGDIATGVEYGGKGPRLSDVLVAGTEYAVPVAPSEMVEGSDPEYVSEKMETVNKFLDQLLAANISCEGEVVKGDPGSWIADEGQRLDAELIIVGGSSHGVVKRTFLGSISDYVLHNAPCTVAIVRQAEDADTVRDTLPKIGNSRRIVLAVDDSKEAIAAFTWGLKNFCTPEDHVILYHVHHPYVAPITGVGTVADAGEFGMEEVYTPPDVIVKDEVASLKDSQKVVQKFMEFADHQTEIKCEGMVVTGETQAKVVQGLNDLKADAVVMGTHDRSTLSRTLLGSVSDHLAHNSPCPVIVVKSHKTDAHTPAASEVTHAHGN